MTLFEQGKNANINIYDDTDMLICKSHYFVFSLLKSASVTLLACSDITFQSEIILVCLIFVDIKEGSPKANKAPQLESTDSIKAKVRCSLKYFLCLWKNMRNYVYIFLQYTTRP